MSRAYDLVGHVTSQTYPSGRTVSYTYDRIGRTTSFTGNLGDSLSRTYMSAIAFDDSGRMIREQFGTTTPLYHKQHWNVRGQLYDMRLSTVNDDSNWNRGAVINYYSLSHYCFGCSGADNNGNLQIQQHFVPGDDLIQTHTLMQQNYAYDSLNRLSWAQEYIQGSGNTPGGGQSYSYDRWGNRTLSGSGTGINTKQFTIDGATNRYGVPTGQAGVMQYDANGNLTNDTYSGFGTRTYDAENRMVTATDSSGGQSIYTYDGEGRRVRRQSGGQVTWQVYGMDGELVAEYAAGAATTAVQKEYGYRNGEVLVTASSGANVQWMVTDQLGTPRIIADRTGSLSGIRRHDYLPFGEEMFAGTGNRTAAGGYAADSVRQKFTQKERDNETGLDYFGARYYSSIQGRFTSADKPFADQFQANPQSWDSYSYVRNSPCNNVDVKGRCSAPSGLKSGQVGICIEAFIAAKSLDRAGIRGRGDGRPFSGDNDKLTSRFRTDIIANRTPGDSSSFDVTQKTTAGTSKIVNPLLGLGFWPAVLSAKGTAETKLNGAMPSADGSSKITTPIGNDGTVKFNVSTTAANGFSNIVDIGSIRTSFNLTVNSNTGQVGIDAGSQASGYPSIAVYSYVYVGKEVVTTEIFKQSEGSPDALKEPMKPIPEVKPK